MVEPIKISIDGMACQGCADSLSGLFQKEPGINKVSVSFDTKEADIEFEPSQISTSRCTEIVKDAGFEVA